MMKSIIYILIAVFISSILISAIPHPAVKQKQVVEIQSVTANPDSTLLNESGLIIKKRLNDYGLQNFKLSLNSHRKTIEIAFDEKVDIKAIMPLLISNGKIEFYETYDRADVIKLLDKGDKLFSLLTIPPVNSETDNSPAILGYCKPEFISQVDSYIAQHYVSKPGEGIKFVQGASINPHGDYYLYLLKHNTGLDKQQILETSISKNPEGNDLMITFNNDGALVWQSLSQKNINKSIAIVIDNMVYVAPVVREEIKNGKCAISGNFTLQELAQLQSLINNEELPLELRMVK